MTDTLSAGCPDLSPGLSAAEISELAPCTCLCQRLEGLLSLLSLCKSLQILSMSDTLCPSVPPKAAGDIAPPSLQPQPLFPSLAAGPAAGLRANEVPLPYPTWKFN